MTTDAETTEGQAEEQSQAINQLDDSLQQLIARLDQLHADMIAGFQQINARLDRLTYTIIGIGGGVIAALVGLIVTLVIQGSP